MAAFDLNVRSVKQKQPMKKTPLRLLIVCSASLFLASCGVVSEKVLTPERIAKIPEPFKSVVIQIRKEQKAVEARYTQGTKTMLRAYSTIAGAIGMKEEAANLMVESMALNAGSSLNDARKAMSRSSGIIKQVQRKIADSKGVTVASKAKFVEGVQIKNQAYVVFANCGTDATLIAIKGTKALNSAIKSKDYFSIPLITASFDPAVYMLRDIPKFLTAQRTFNESCIEFAKVQKISLPPANLPTPKFNIDI